MNVLFLQKDIFAKPSVMALSAILKRAGHRCDVLVDDLEKDITGKGLDMDPDIIAFSITTSEHSWMNVTGTAIREKFKGIMVCGGPHPTLYPRIIQDSFLDALCRGEGDEAFLEFVNALQEGNDIKKIRNFVVKMDGDLFQNELRPLIQDLDRLPFFDRNIYERYSLYRKSTSASLMHKTVRTGRGCPYDCAFCINSSYKQIYRNKGKIVRHRSVDNLIEELSEMARDRDLKFLSFEDDSFTLAPRDWLFDFLKRYRHEVGIPFKIQTTARLLDEGTVRALKEANCYSIRFGIEAGNENYRNRVLKKKISDEDIFRAARLAKRYGIRLQTFNIMLSPGETLEMCLETYDMNRKIRPDFAWCSLLNPYPGTEIASYARETDSIETDIDYHDRVHSFFLGSPIKAENKRKIHNLQKLAYFSILTHLPRRALLFLIGLPLTKLYALLFGVTFFIGLYRIDKTSLRELVKLSLGHWIRYLRQG
ncbi:MAG: radical SAM protein [Dehalococcoidia bacterium]